MISHFKLTGINHTTIDVLSVYPSHPIGIIQIVHGMCDHKKRYLDMMTYFSNLGYVCVCHDHIGHGLSAESSENLGYFGDDGSQILVENTYIVNQYIHHIYPHLPIYLFGHSMGSYISRVYLKNHASSIQGLILCGFVSYNPLASFAKKVCHLLIKVKGERYRSPWVYKLTFGAYNKNFKESQLPYRWLSKDEAVAEAFGKDPYCNYTFTLNGFYYLFDLACQTYSLEGWSKDHLDLPIFVIAGEDDPCIVNSKTFYKSVSFLKSIGYTTIKTKLYPTLRHELFNEKEKKDVFNDIDHWIKQRKLS